MKNELIQELEEADKQERLQRLWDEYGGYFIAFCVLAVMFTGLITGWQSWDRRVKETQTSALFHAFDKEDNVEALKNISAELNAGLRSIAQLSAAGIELNNDNNEAALAFFQNAAQDKSQPEIFQDLALLMSVRLKWADTKDAKLLTNLQPLLTKPSSPWHAHAHIQAALIKASENNYQEAQNFLEVVLNKENIPPSLKERAIALRHVYMLEQPLKNQTEGKTEDQNQNKEPQG